jgi:uncharacterized membrane-anchored protein
MTDPAGIIGRIPRVWLFAAAALIQVALVAMMIADRISILRAGTDITLQTRPVDPRDFLRGDYVRLAYDISSVPAGVLKGQPAARAGTTIFVELAPNADGVYQAVALHAQPVAVTRPDVLIRGRVIGETNCGVGHNGCHNVMIDYGIENYFVPQDEGRAIEQARNKGQVLVVAAVTPSGRAAIKRLLIDGKPVYDEPWF